jgi:prepilin-type N-terminal cleavage/methylation domain-containing protein
MIDPRDQQAGFTLLEVLIGLVISSLILTGLSFAMSAINRGYDKMGAAIDRQGTLSTGLSVFEQDVSRIVRIPEDPAKPLRFLFTGQPRGMVYVLAERPGSNTAGLYWVRLVIRAAAVGDELVRQRAPFSRPLADPASISWGDEVVLLRGGSTLGFSYRSPRAGLRDWAGSWLTENRLPSQIRIDITDAATGRARVPPFTATLKLSAEADCASGEAAGCTIRSDGALIPPRDRPQ